MVVVIVVVMVVVIVVVMVVMMGGCRHVSQVDLPERCFAMDCKDKFLVSVVASCRVVVMVQFFALMVCCRLCTIVVLLW